ncbi:unnamed protein product [Symbiodinium sp. CCMP2592]|nr:unnamed protein product [Symbiodinium sp. CCMP2592]
MLPDARTSAFVVLPQAAPAPTSALVALPDTPPDVRGEACYGLTGSLQKVTATDGLPSVVVVQEPLNVTCTPPPEAAQRLQATDGLLLPLTQKKTQWAPRNFLHPLSAGENHKVWKRKQFSVTRERKRKMLLNMGCLRLEIDVDEEVEIEQPDTLPRGGLRHQTMVMGNVRNYAQEGVLVLLCEDHLSHFSEDYEHVLDDRQCQHLGGRCHILWAHGAKAKRISYSTSHAETLAAISGLEAGTLVSVRLAELLYSPKMPTIQSLTAQQERGVVGLPIDSFTDCRDFFELASGDKNAPQDKNQRLYVLSFREARMTGRIRWMGLVPTESMTADSLTKTMIAGPMMQLLTTGTVEFHNQEKHHVTLRALPTTDHIEERHFDLDDRELIKEFSKPAIDITACLTFVKPRFMCMALLTTTAASTSTTPTTSSTPSDADDGWKWIVTIVVIVIAAERLLCETAKLWWRRLFEENEDDRASRLLREKKEKWFREGHDQAHGSADDPMDVCKHRLESFSPRLLPAGRFIVTGLQPYSSSAHPAHEAMRGLHGLECSPILSGTLSGVKLRLCRCIGNHDAQTCIRRRYRSALGSKKQLCSKSLVLGSNNWRRRLDIYLPGDASMGVARFAFEP